MTRITAILTDFPFDSNWVKGTVGDYTFEAKLFDNGSTYGINNGRISKLSIYNDGERVAKRNFFAAYIVNYDRGWDIKPTKEAKPYFKAVIELLEATPRRFDLAEAVN